MVEASHHYTEAVQSLILLQGNLIRLLEECGRSPVQQQAMLDAFELPVGSDEYAALFRGRTFDMVRAAVEFAKLRAAMLQYCQAIEAALDRYDFESHQAAYEQQQIRTLAKIKTQDEFEALLRAEQSLRDQYWPDTTK